MKGHLKELKKKRGKSPTKYQARENQKENVDQKQRKLQKKHIETSTRKRKANLYGHSHSLPVTRLTKQIHDMTSTLISLTNRAIDKRKCLQKANIKQDEILDKDTPRNKIRKWEVSSSRTRKTKSTENPPEQRKQGQQPDDK